MTVPDGQPVPGPTTAGDEVATLLGSLERQRATFAWKVGLDVRIKYGHGGGPDNPPSLRRLLADMIEEYARHVGHADLIRETIDGLVGEDPPKAVYPYMPPAKA
jgi:hypothetical protein